MQSKTHTSTLLTLSALLLIVPFLPDLRLVVGNALVLMMFLSGIWFSLEGAHPWMQQFALLLPLTHVTDAARAIMIDGANIVQVSDHLLILGGSSVVLLLIGARIFRWE